MVDINVTPQVKRLIKYGQNGRKKTVEVRPNTGRGRFSTLQQGDLIQFNGDRHCLRQVVEIRHYDTLDALIEAEEPESIWPGQSRQWLKRLAGKMLATKPRYWRPPFLAIELSEL